MIRIMDLPTREQPYGEHVIDNCALLEKFDQDFSSAINLFNFCELDKFASRSWRFIACRDASVTIYNFAFALQGIFLSLKGCPSAAPAVDQSALRAASKKFHAQFPRFEDVRDSVAHAGQLFSTPSETEKHAIKGGIESEFLVSRGSARVTVRDSLFNRKYTTTIRGRLVEFEMTDKSAQALTNCQRLANQAVSKLQD